MLFSTLTNVDRCRFRFSWNTAKNWDHLLTRNVTETFINQRTKLVDILITAQFTEGGNSQLLNSTRLSTARFSALYESHFALREYISLETLPTTISLLVFQVFSWKLEANEQLGMGKTKSTWFQVSDQFNLLISWKNATDHVFCVVKHFPWQKIFLNGTANDQILLVIILDAKM